MASLREKLSQIAPKVTVDETLCLLGLLIPAASLAVIPDDSIAESKQQVLENRLISSALHDFMILCHKENIEEAYGKLVFKAQQIRDALSRLNRPCIPPHVLIRFVSTLEEANRYFDFKTSAKQAHDFEHLCSPDDVSHVLHQDEQLMSEFPKIGDTQLKRAAEAIFWELYYQHLGSEYAYHFEDPKLYDWIYELAFRTREKGYVIDDDPIVELEKVREDALLVYNDYFLSERLPVECTETLATTGPRNKEAISEKVKVTTIATGSRHGEALEQERAVQEARSKYSQLVSSMLAKNKEASYEKTSAATGSRNKEAISEKVKVTTTATGSRHGEALEQESSVQEARSKYSQPVSSMPAKNKEASYEKTSAATGPRNKEAISEKVKVTTTATGSRHGEATSLKHELTSIATSAKVKEGFSYMHQSKRKRSFEMTVDIHSFPKKLKRGQASKKESRLCDFDG